MERREPIIEEEEPEPEPQPETASAGGVRPPGRIGGGLRDDEGGDEPPGSGQVPGWFSTDPPSLPVEDLNLSMRGYNVLRRNGIRTVGDILDRTEDELLGLRNLGRKAYDELRERLDQLRIVPIDKPWDLWRGRWKGEWK